MRSRGTRVLAGCESRWGIYFDGYRGEIALRLAYTRRSEGQRLPERPFALWWN